MATMASDCLLFCAPGSRHTNLGFLFFQIHFQSCCFEKQSSLCVGHCFERIAVDVTRALAPAIEPKCSHNLAPGINNQHYNREHASRPPLERQKRSSRPRHVSALKSPAVPPPPSDPRESGNSRWCQRQRDAWTARFPCWAMGVRGLDHAARPPRREQERKGWVTSHPRRPGGSRHPPGPQDSGDGSCQ